MLKTVLASSIALAGCWTPDLPSAVQPHPSFATQPLAEREAMYSRYHLEPTEMGLGTAYKRADGTHTYMDLRDSFGQYPRSRALYRRVANRDATLANLTIYGLAFGLVGGIDQVATLDGSDTMTQTGRNVFYGIGGALLVTAGIAALAWHNPMKQLAAAYNEELRADLALPGGPSPTASATALRF
jgi:hypothetical protein